MDNSQPTEIVVSVWMPAYYAGDHIRQGIESILMQETEYSYEIVINDDCSGDNTWDIISEYAEKYPNLIRAIRNEKNLGLSANVLATKMRCRGKYIVNLSGDDYWIDPKKIQKQVDFLKANPEYIGVGSKVEMRYDDAEEAFLSYPSPKVLGKDFTIEEYNNGINLPSHGFMLRNIFADDKKRELVNRIYSVSSAIDDLFDPVLFLQCGKIFIMPEATCVYRVARSKKGRHNFNSTKKANEKALTIFDGYMNLEKLQIPQVDLKKRFCDVFNMILLSGILDRNLKIIRSSYKRIPIRYRTPWYKGIGFLCFFSVWSAGFNFLKGRIKKILLKH